MKMPLTLLVVAFIALTGCATKSKTDRMLEAQPPAYADGYLAGCESGKSAAGSIYHSVKKDAQRAADDKLYATGWNDGFAQCKGSYEANVRTFPGGR